MTNAMQIYPEQGIEAALGALRAARTVVCDIDGVLLMDGGPIEGAGEFLMRHRCVFVSNNSTHTAATLSALFNRIGLASRPQQFFLAGEAAVEYLHDYHAGAPVLVLASDDVARLAHRRLLVCEDPVQAAGEAEWVLVCRDRTITFEKIEAAANAIRRGARAVVSNLDMTHPAGAGAVHTETGALWQALRMQLDDTAESVVIGKPCPELLLRAQERLGLLPQELVFLRDNLLTDAPAAAQAGVPFIHVGAGGFRLAELVRAEVRREDLF